MVSHSDDHGHAMIHNDLTRKSSFERTAVGVTGQSQVIATNVDVDEKIFSYLKPGITASFIGSSGVGKSTLINKLMGIDVIVTAEIGKNDKGRHTTTGREMMILPNGGIVIDTLEVKCKFRNCTHTSEPGCAIQKALADGLIAK